MKTNEDEIHRNDLSSMSKLKYSWYNSMQEIFFIPLELGQVLKLETLSFIQLSPLLYLRIHSKSWTTYHLIWWYTDCIFMLSSLGPVFVSFLACDCISRSGLNLLSGWEVFLWLDFELWGVCVWTFLCMIYGTPPLLYPGAVGTKRFIKPLRLGSHDLWPVCALSRYHTTVSNHLVNIKCSFCGVLSNRISKKNM